MTNRSGTDATADVPAIVTEVAQLRGQLSELEEKRRDASRNLEHLLPADWMADEMAFVAEVERQESEIHEKILDLARQVTAPHPLWPGGWLIENPERDDPDLRWRRPYTRPYGSPPAWRTREEAEANLPSESSRPYRVVWSPTSQGRQAMPLDVETWAKYGNVSA